MLPNDFTDSHFSQPCNENAARKVVYFVVDQKGSTSVLVRMPGLYYIPEMFHCKFMNRLPVSRHHLKVTSETVPTKISLRSSRTPFLMRKLTKRSAKIAGVNTVSVTVSSAVFVNIF
jgi:hypothetical protein